MHLPINSLLQNGRYRIIKIIGQGGFGCTYQAEHTFTHKQVAIKEFFAQTYCDRQSDAVTMRIATTSNSKLVEKLKKKFIDEAVALMNLDHKGIVHVHDAFEENNTAYYVMDFIEGSSLDELIKKQGTLSEKQSLDIIMQVCDALDYVHSNNRLHLDIKPGNIMITPDGKVKLIDFGVSKQYDEVEGNNTSTLMGKTPGYAPVEQMSNAVVNFTPATDIYAVGATLYKMLTGKTPLDATVIAAGETQAPLPSSISPSTRAAVDASMKLIKTQRPQSIHEFTGLLTESVPTPTFDWESTEINTPAIPKPKAKTPPPTPKIPPQKAYQAQPRKNYNAQKQAKSNNWTIAIIVTIIVLALGGVGIYYIVNRNSNNYYDNYYDYYNDYDSYYESEEALAEPEVECAPYEDVVVAEPDYYAPAETAEDYYYYDDNNYSDDYYYYDDSTDYYY